MNVVRLVARLERESDELKARVTKSVADLIAVAYNEDECELHLFLAHHYPIILAI